MRKLPRKKSTRAMILALENFLNKPTKSNRASLAQAAVHYDKVTTAKRLPALAALVIVLMSTAASAADFYDARGNKIGSSTTTGATTNFYDARGSRTQSSTTIGNTTTHYDPRGNKIGSTTGRPR